jgi:heat shock protein HslJ
MKPFALIIILALTISSCSSTKHIYIADHLVDCEGAGPQKCMLTKDKIVDNWSNFYDQIEGFTYEEGYEYLLGVKVKKIKNPPADGSSLKYTLVEVYEKKKNEIPITIDNKWVITSMEGIDLSTVENKPTILLDGANKKISGFAGCNNYFGEYDPENKNMGFSKMGMTRKMCPDMTVENTFMNNMRNVKMMGIDQDKLLFYDNNQKVIISCKLQ